MGPRTYDDRGAYEYQPLAPGESAPTAALVVAPTAGAVPLAVTADASGSTDTDATPIATYTFDFGDRTTVGPQAAATADHVYATAGTFTVTVTAKDTVGLASTARTSVTAQAPPTDSPPAAALVVSPTSGTVPLAVTADASSSTDTDATPIATYAFDFGDGTMLAAQQGATAAHTYTTAGTFTVTVTATDTGGLSSSSSVKVQAQADSAPVAALSVSPANGRAPLAVTADASRSTDTDGTPIATYTFDFGDGAVVGPQAAATATHTYTTKGTFTVGVTVADTAGLTSRATKNVKAR